VYVDPYGTIVIPLPTIVITGAAVSIHESAPVVLVYHPGHGVQLTDPWFAAKVFAGHRLHDPPVIVFADHASQTLQLRSVHDATNSLPGLHTGATIVTVLIC
jgi:hypothetical protein